MSFYVQTLQDGKLNDAFLVASWKEGDSKNKTIIYGVPIVTGHNFTQAFKAVLEVSPEEFLNTVNKQLADKDNHMRVVAFR